MAQWWAALSEPFQIGILQFIATLVAAIIAMFAVFVQVSRQAKKNRDLADKVATDKIKLEIYDQCLASTNKASRSVLAATSYVRNYISLVGASASGPPLTADRIPTRWPQFADLHWEAMSSTTEIVYLVEKWQSVDPRLLVFRLAFAHSKHEIDKAFWPLSRLLMVSLPTDRLDTASLTWTPPDHNALRQISQAFEVYQLQMDRMGVYVIDFQNEMQQALVAPLFKNKVEKRDAPDPELFTIRLDEHDAIEKRLMLTEWGQRAQQFEAEAYLRFKAD